MENKTYQIIKNGKIFYGFKSEAEANFWAKELRKLDKIANIKIVKI